MLTLPDAIFRVAITSQRALRYRTGKPPLPIRWVLVQDASGQFPPQALLDTDPATDPFQGVQWFVIRWQLEVTFQEV